MTVKETSSMNIIIGKVLRYGVLFSASIIILGTIGLAGSKGYSDASAFLQYPDSISRNVPTSFAAFYNGLVALSAFAWIELGVIVLIATPVSRVLVSVFLFGGERDRLYVLITAVVLTLLLFSMLITPFIPLFHG
ncbi:MAG: DUF1634 domain-containing protein [Nitrososphaerota archaeon]|nr:DUF1634 domain-containing protein [Nitrososphaerota archaeon]MDG7023907.1 DUF1634 domain-containing protein [Nitrososphaerota archaeon]